MKKWKGSITITALITIIILVVIALALINLTRFMIINSDSEQEKLNARWFLEGRVQEYFDNLITGRKQPVEGLFRLEFPLEGKSQPYELALTRKDGGKWLLTASLLWKRKFRLGQEITFQSLDLFNYTIYVNGAASWTIGNRMLIMGRVGLKSGPLINSSGAGSLLFHYSSQYPYRIESGSANTGWTTFIFTNDLETSQDQLFPDIPPLKDKKDVTTVRTELAATVIPDFNKIWLSYYQQASDNWTISNDTSLPVTGVVNNLTTAKELIAIGDGFTTRFDMGDRKTSFVYLKKLTTALRYQNIPSLDYAYGFNRALWGYLISTNSGKLNLIASEKLVSIRPTEESFTEPAIIKTGDADWSVMSIDESIDKLVLDSDSLADSLIQDSDYTYDQKGKTIRVSSAKYNYNHLLFIGTGNGFQKTFELPSMVHPNFIAFYSGTNKMEGYSVSGNSVTFNTAPAADKAVTGFFNFPIINLQKAPPDENTGVFVDLYEKAVVLNLDSLYNMPENGIIISYIPLVVKGTAHFPLAIISKENIYLETVNPSNSGEPLLIASGKGVWFYKRNFVERVYAHKCFIYSPLPVLPTLLESGGFMYSPSLLHGGVIFGCENTNGVLLKNTPENDYVYYTRIHDYLLKKPFSYFPLPFEIEKVLRN